MNKAFLFLIVSILTFVTPSFFIKSYALQGSSFNTLARADEDYKYDEYYQVAALNLESANYGYVNLLKFEMRNQKFPVPQESYDRKKHFGTWIKPDQNSCMNTRGHVLARDSKVEVETNAYCTVLTGDWVDPYTNQNFTKASDIQIDHLVPLKNAYMTGAYEWDASKRCLYANFLGNDFHLLAVYATENNKKGDKSPREYLPPNKQYVCNYLRDWLEVKFVWNLRLTPTEVEQIRNEIKTHNCTKEDFLVPQSEINRQIRYIEANKNLCKLAS